MNDSREEQSRYSAIGFDYNNVADGNRTSLSSAIDKECDDSTNDTVYLCPPNLRLLPGMVTPTTEREAAIIEQTAKFVADKGPQLEILIKTKQANNPKFVFLNYDHRLHPFYRHITHLIKTAQYVPGKRHISHLVESNGNSDTSQSVPLPIAPKIDISSTPYGKLIERFKLAQERKSKLALREKEEKETTRDLIDENHSNNHNSTSSSSNTSPGNAKSSSSTNTDNFDSVSIKSLFEQRSPSPASVELAEARHKMYEDLYQQYYPYYHAYYLDNYGTATTETGQPDNVAVVEMARNSAASSAAAWIQANMPENSSSGSSHNNSNKAESRDAVIAKMAEYVARNGLDFEQLMLSRNSERFAFLLPGHADHYQYKKQLDKEIDKLASAVAAAANATNRCQRSPSPEQVIESIIDSYGLSPPHSSCCPISFKMNASRQRTAVASVVNSVANDNLLAPLDELDDDFDFTDKLQSKHDNNATHRTDNSSSSGSGTKNGRISRFSPANPKNLIAVAHLKNDLQVQRKRKAAEFLASRAPSDKVNKTDDSTTSYHHHPSL